MQSKKRVTMKKKKIERSEILWKQQEWKEKKVFEGVGGEKKNYNEH